MSKMARHIWGGAMSGTSADGVDVAFIEAAPFRLLHYSAYPYTRRLREKIMAARTPGARFTLAEVAELGDDIAVEHARAISAAAKTSGFSLCGGDGVPTVVGIGVHGQTLYHAPPRTLQHINGPLLAALLNCQIICDFRRADCAAGGQGAPLVPFADVALFRDPAVSRVLLNLGGIANITTLPAGEAGQVDAGVLAFDTGPANCISDALCSKWSISSMASSAAESGAADGPHFAAAAAEACARGYDDAGRLASRGKVHAGLLAAALEDSRYDAAAQASGCASGAASGGPGAGTGAASGGPGAETGTGAAAVPVPAPGGGFNYFVAPPPKSTDTPAMLQLWGRAAASALAASSISAGAASPSASCVPADAVAASGAGGSASTPLHPCCAAANAGLTLPDALATACALTAVTAAAGIVAAVAESRRRLAAAAAAAAVSVPGADADATYDARAGVVTNDSPWQVIVSGGGAANDVIMRFLRLLLVRPAVSSSPSLEMRASEPELPPCAFAFVAAAGGAGAGVAMDSLAGSRHEMVERPAAQMLISAVEPSSLALGMPEGAKEAAAFALLAAACISGKPNNVPACTGAAFPVVGGVIVPRPFAEGMPGQLLVGHS